MVVCVIWLFTVGFVKGLKLYVINKSISYQDVDQAGDRQFGARCISRVLTLIGGDGLFRSLEVCDL